MRHTPIIALDFSTIENVRTFLEPFQEQRLFLKIGMELFYRVGPSIVTELKERGHDIFLDLKLHDIPNTVKMGMHSLASIGGDIVNVHAAGGKAMMEAALEGLDKGTAVGKKRPYCIAVTQLTSTSAEQMREEQLIQTTLQQSILHYGQLTKQSGLDGVVCSPHESKLIHDTIGKDFLTVTPGIRLTSDDTDDQKRTATPTEARQMGSDLIVVGRSITKAANPVAAYFDILKEWGNES